MLMNYRIRTPMTPKGKPEGKSNFEKGLTIAVGYIGKPTAIAINIAVFIALCLITYYFIGPKIIYPVWEWGGDAWYYRIVAIVGELIIIIFTLLLYTPCLLFQHWIISQYAEEQTCEMKERLNALINDSEILELADEFKDKDDDGLLPAVRYSTKILTTYYEISIKHTQKSFTYSIIAMFTGFAIIMIGILNSFGFFESIGLVKTTPTNINDVVIAGSVVAETISALFLWVFKQSQNQLEYFYNRQMQLYDALLTYRIANSMGDKVKDNMGNTLKDKSKQEIVRSIIETSTVQPIESKTSISESIQKIFKLKT